MLSSPFPGIDPYIKAQGSCRTSTPASSRICAMRWLISCPFNYEARIDERLNLVELPAEKLRRIKPDLAVSRGELSRGPSPVSAGVVTLEPVTIPLVIEEEARETYIEILHRPDRTFVTVIELLSPSNKEDPGRALFLAKTEFAAVPAGPRRRTGPADLSPAIAAFAKAYPAGQFFALVARGNWRPDCQVYVWTVRQPFHPSRFHLWPQTRAFGSR